MDNFYTIQSGNNNFINKAISLVEAGEEMLAFIALDISNFKYINDFYGMQEGDRVMEDIASFFFINEPLCRAAYGMGFDQFRGIYDVTAMSKEDFISYLTQKSHEFESMLSTRYPLVYNHVYIGIYFYEDSNVDVRMATDRSNLAKKAIKGMFNTNCRVFTENNCKAHYENMHMSNMFMHSSVNGGIELYIQPKVSVSKNCVVGGEALVRMRDGKGGIIMPGSFVPVLESIGLIDRLDKIMIEKVFAFQRQCLDAGKKVYAISVNVSKQEFTSLKFVEKIFQLQKKYQIEPDLIEFELVESTFVNDLSSIVETISSLRSEGFRISVDDFGAGYSSLNQIANIPADVIKFDGVFARDSLNTEKGRAVVKSLITMLNDVNYKIVFEGIENQKQLELVASYGCDTIQGFYYSRPIPAEDFVNKYGVSDSLT
ncbi:MAG: EAL domain-containing protein [Lachnospiraceae bacterium]|nr:EAL domain-containing protein [Lachnospiraceae bacterium]